MKLRILYHHRTQGRGAEGLHIRSIVHALEAMGHSVTVVSPPGIDPLDAGDGAPVDKARVQTRGVQSLWKAISRQLPNALFELAEIAYNIPAWWRLRKELRRARYDLIYERYAFYLIAGAVLARRHGIPFVLEANEVSGIENRARPQSFPRLCSWFERRLFSRCTGIHTVSSHLKKRILRQGVEAERVHVVPNAFDVRRLGGRHGRRSDLVDRYGLSGKLIIGFAGWFDRWDRLDMLIDVFRQLKNEHPELALLLIGDGPVTPGLKQRAEQYRLEDVVFTGAVPRKDVYDYIALIDIAVLPHSNDFGSPVVMFEFMGLRIPVVAPCLEPILDVHDGDETAMLFDPLDVAGCRAALKRLIEEPLLRQRIAERAYAKLLSDHTWDKNARAILAAAQVATDGIQRNDGAR